MVHDPVPVPTHEGSSHGPLPGAPTSAASPPPRPLTIQEELQRRRPFRSTREALFLALLRTAAVVRRPVAKVIEEAGVSLAQYNVLRILRGAGERGLPTLALRERMIEEAAGITRLIDKLERAGLVRRERGAAADRRQVFCIITPAGCALLEGVDPAVAEVTRDVVAGLDDASVDGLLATLDEVRAHAHRLSDGQDGSAYEPASRDDSPRLPVGAAADDAAAEPGI